MKVKEFCEAALSNDLIGFVDDILRGDPLAITSSYKLLLSNSAILEKEVDRFTYGKIKGYKHTILLVKIK